MKFEFKRVGVAHNCEPYFSATFMPFAELENMNSVVD